MLVELHTAYNSCSHGKWEDGDCNCYNGWTGDRCDNIRCTHGDAQGSHCTCHNGWTGTHCDDIVCYNGGQSHSYHGRQSCTCSHGWEGAHCDDIVCFNHGYLHNYNDNHYCTCVNGWTGTHCESILCFNGIPQNGQCTCDASYTGTHCDVLITSTTTTTTASTTTTTQPTTTTTVPTTPPPAPTYTCQPHALDPLTSHQPVSHPSAVQCLSGSHDSHEAIILNFCPALGNDTNMWKTGNKVLPCNNIPQLTAVAAFDNGQYVSAGGLSGLFMGCDADGFKIEVQECGLAPTIITIPLSGGINLMDAKNYYTINV